MMALSNDWRYKVLVLVHHRNCKNPDFGKEARGAGCCCEDIVAE
jgi:hypothetical protein